MPSLDWQTDKGRSQEVHTKVCGVVTCAVVSLVPQGWIREIMGPDRIVCGPGHRTEREEHRGGRTGQAGSTAGRETGRSGRRFQSWCWSWYWSRERGWGWRWCWNRSWNRCWNRNWTWHWRGCRGCYPTIAPPYIINAPHILLVELFRAPEPGLGYAPGEDLISAVPVHGIACRAIHPTIGGGNQEVKVRGRTGAPGTALRRRIGECAPRRIP
jgi:hypothetical protein